MFCLNSFNPGSCKFCFVHCKFKWLTTHGITALPTLLQEPPIPAPADLPAVCTQTRRSSAWPQRDSLWTHPTRASAPWTPAAARRTGETRSRESSSWKKSKARAQPPTASTPRPHEIARKSFCKVWNPSRTWCGSRSLAASDLVLLTPISMCPMAALRPCVCRETNWSHTASHPHQRVDSVSLQLYTGCDLRCLATALPCAHISQALLAIVFRSPLLPFIVVSETCWNICVHTHRGFKPTMFWVQVARALQLTRTAGAMGRSRALSSPQMSGWRHQLLWKISHQTSMHGQRCWYESLQRVV